MLSGWSTRPSRSSTPLTSTRHREQARAEAGEELVGVHVGVGGDGARAP